MDHKLPDHLVAKFQAWKLKFAKSYATEELSNYRLQVYLETLSHIERHNSEGHSYTLAENQFSDLTDEEWQSIYLMPVDHNSALYEDRTKIPNVAAKNWTA